MPAKNPSATLGTRYTALSLAIFAGKPAPTGIGMSLEIYIARYTFARYIHLATYLARKLLAQTKPRGISHANSVYRSSHRHWRP